MKNVSLEADYKKLKYSEMMDLTIEFTTDTIELLSTVTPSNGITPLEPRIEKNNVSTDGVDFNIASSSKNLPSFKISDILHTDPET